MDSRLRGSDGVLVLGDVALLAVIPAQAGIHFADSLEPDKTRQFGYLLRKLSIWNRVECYYSLITAQNKHDQGDDSGYRRNDF